MDFACKFCRIVCCYNRHYNGIRHDLPFPIQGEELVGDGQHRSSSDEAAQKGRSKHVYDKGWMESALRASGVLSKDGSDRVTKMKVEIPSFGGLLSQIRTVDIEIESADVTSTGIRENDGDQSRHSASGKEKQSYGKQTSLGRRLLSCVAKFSPNALKTRITTDLFDMAETEYAFYDKIAPILAEKCDLRVPQIYYMDINMTTLNTAVIMERLPESYKFYDQLDPKALSLEDAKLVVRALARFNGAWLGRDTLDRNHDILGQIKFSEDKKLRYFGLVAKMAFKKVSNPNQMKNGKRVRWTYKIPKKLEELLKTSVFKNARKLLQSASKGPTVGLTHGDPRLENFFFYEEKTEAGTCHGGDSSKVADIDATRVDARGLRRRVGMVDFQLVIKTSVLQDLAWFVGTSCTVEFAKKHEKALLEAYLDELERSGAITTTQRPIFEREYRIAFLAVLLKVIIGCDGIDMDVPRSLSLSDAHMIRTIAACERHDVCTLWKEWLDEYDSGTSALSSSTAKIAPAEES